MTAFPAISRKPSGIRILPVGKLDEQLALNADDPDEIYLEVLFSPATSDYLNDPATLRLPNVAKDGKVFNIRLTLKPTSGNFDNPYRVLIVGGTTRTNTTTFSYRLGFGQTARFVFSEKYGWLQPAGGGVFSSDGNSQGTEKNSSANCISEGEGSIAHCTSVAIGRNSKALTTNASMGSAAVGYNAGAGYDGCVAMGYNAACTGTEAVAIGPSSGAPYNSVVIGSGATATSTDCVLVGRSSSGTSYGVALGNSATAGASNVAVGNSSSANDGGGGIAVGRNSWSAGSRAVALGYSANAYQDNVAVGGDSVANDSTGGMAIGRQATCNHEHALALGYKTNTQRVGEVVKTADGSANGVVRRSWSVVGLQNQTTNSTPTEALCAGIASKRFTLRPSTIVAFKALVTARQDATGDAKVWELAGAVKQGAAAANTAIVGTVDKTIIANDTGAAAWDVSFTADTTNGALTLTVTGETSKTIDWYARVDIAEIRT